MDQAIIHGQTIEQWLERRARRAPSLDHVDMAGAGGIAIVARADIGAHRHAPVVDDQHGGRSRWRQAGQPGADAGFGLGLQVGIDQAGDTALARCFPAQAFGQQGGLHGRLQLAADHRLLQRSRDHLRRPDAQVTQAQQHLVARRLRPLRMAIGTVAAGRLRQHREQGGLGVAELLRRLAQPGPTGRGHALDGAAERCVIQIQAKDLAFVQAPLQLQGTHHLAELGGRAVSARRRLQYPRHLHGQGGTARDDAAMAHGLPGCPDQGQGINARMVMEAAVLVGE